MFGTRLKGLRESQGLTQNDLAIRLHIARSTIALYETNTNEPDFKTLIAIADIFNVSLDYLLCRSDEKYNITLMDSSSREFLIQFHELINSFKILKK